MSEAAFAVVPDRCEGFGLPVWEYQSSGTSILCIDIPVLHELAGDAPRAREAYARVVRPEILRRLETAVRLPATVIEEAFLEANPTLTADGLTITCKAGRIEEARICLTRDLEPRLCSGSVARDCTMRDALLEPVR